MFTCALGFIIHLLMIKFVFNAHESPGVATSGWGGGPSLLLRGEKRLRQGHGQGAPGRNFGSAGSPRVACPTSVPERLELYGEARPKPPTLRRRVSKSKRPPPFGGYLKSEKSAVLTHFSDDFQLFEMDKML